MNTHRVFHVGLVLAISLMLALTTPVNAQVSLPPGTYTQNFDTLANSGTSSVVPTGWAFSESGTNANTTYTAGTGSSNAGDTYSFGATASTERAFGGLFSGSLNPTLGVQFQNNTGVTIGRLAVTYNCEHWRLGATGRTDRLDFQYSTDATSLTTGTWTDFDALDCIGSTATGTVGALDGNISRTLTSGTIVGLNISNGATFWFRWNDFNATGADDGLAIDDFQMQLFTPTAMTLLTLHATTHGPIWPLAVALVGGSVLAGWLWWRRRRA